MKRINKLHLCSLMMAISSALLSGQASAQSSFDTVDAYAGIAPTLELTCSDVNFGVWRMGTGSRGGDTLITLPSDGSAAVRSGGTAALSNANSHQAPVRSTCQLKGSGAPNATVATVTLKDNTNMTFAGTSSNNFAVTLPAPVSAAALTANLTASTLAPVISGGSTQVYIGGELTIPDNIVEANYGSYKTSAPLTVTLEDNQ
ncbi:DUF4402 domain-containing protein [Plesiomonas shigelloides]|uniref:DUF4402 domain-containing protein n=1 Tax=Plesiomonas shigelloides TaxID=703 RepID=UPI001262381E|nr:DUF4402 domain-containing protein [Plesiomonas shigelloides]KAB7689737.1 DUF4402 domain-containing protein [Plesiomonas shigelloides]